MKRVTAEVASAPAAQPAAQESAIVNPATGEIVARIPCTGADEVDEAVLRARAAAPAWARITPSDRARLIRRFAREVADHLEELASIESGNTGKPITDATGEIEGVAGVLEFYAGCVETHRGATIPVAGGIDMTFHEPVGVVAAIVPWNFPALITSWKVAPALACANAVIVKPAELTPLSAIRLAELALEAGIPEGVLQVLPGKGSVAGSALVRHPDVAKVGFTGSTEVGAEVMREAAGHIARVTLELGGKSACVVFADADLEAAAAAAPLAVFGNAGQDCCARSRFLVERPVQERFVGLLAEATASLRIGDPADPATQVGPLISSGQRERVRAFVEPLEEGVTFAHRLVLPESPGFFFGPVILEAASHGARVCQEEIFGPVATVVPFADEEEAVRLANGTPYGLSGSIWTRDGARALRCARAIRSGTLSVNSNTSVRTNAPFGGMGRSGIGRELGVEAMAAYSEVKNVFVSTAR